MKHFFSDPELSFNQIVFEHRNKEYGAYDLRTESNRILAKSLFLSLAVIAGISLTVFIASPKDKIISSTGDGVEVDIENIYEAPDKPVEPDVIKPETQVTPPPAKDIKTYDDRELTPTANANDSQLLQKIPDDAVSGTKNNFDGEVATTQNPQTDRVPNDNGTGKLPVKDPVIIKPAGNEVFGSGELSVAANFIGGIDAFRNKVIDKFDTADFENEGVLSTVITFVVEKDGTISGLKAEIVPSLSTVITFVVEKDGTISGLKADGKNADFNKEAIRTIMNVKGKWTPGKDKFGQAVRSYFKFPVKMRFDQ